MKIVSLTNPQVATGLRLGGLKDCHVVENPERAREQLIELSNNKEIGILIVDDNIARLHHKLISEIRSRNGVFPIIVEVRTHIEAEEGEGQDPLKDLIKRAIGVDISAEQEGETKLKL